MTKFSTSSESVHAIACDLLAVPVFSNGTGPGLKQIESALGTPFSELVARATMGSDSKPGFKGDLGETLLVDTLGTMPAKAVLFVGLGEKANGSATQAVRAGAAIARRAGSAATVATSIPRALKGKPDTVGAAFAEGFLLATYRFERYKAEPKGAPNRIEQLTILGDKRWDARAARRAVARAEAIATGVNLARDLTNTPSSDKSPESLADEARKLARAGKLKLKVFDEKELAAKGFGGILGVGRGSPKPPRLIELRYEVPGAKRTIALVGKGITFDSGGLNLKPANSGIDWMKMDMGGGAAVLGAMSAIATLKPKVNVWAYVASAENMPDGDALRPGDVITQYGGTTVEIGNTDAEGRLVMADAIAYARERGADVIVDIATLTGACHVALGTKVFGVIGTPRAEVRTMIDAAERAGEKAWELPLEADYLPVMKSDIADLRNHRSTDVGAGATLAALFLKEFAGDTPWVHLDIAGTAKSDKEEHENPKWATGSGVRTLVEYVLSQ